MMTRAVPWRVRCLAAFPIELVPSLRAPLFTTTFSGPQENDSPPEVHKAGATTQSPKGRCSGAGPLPDYCNSNCGQECNGLLLGDAESGTLLSSHSSASLHPLKFLFWQQDGTAFLQPPPSTLQKEHHVSPRLHHCFPTTEGKDNTSPSMDCSCCPAEALGDRYIQSSWSVAATLSGPSNQASPTPYRGTYLKFPAHNHAIASSPRTTLPCRTFGSSCGQKSQSRNKGRLIPFQSLSVIEYPLWKEDKSKFSLMQSRQLSSNSGPAEKQSEATHSLGTTFKVAPAVEDSKEGEQTAGPSVPESKAAGGWSTWTKDEAFNLPNGISMSRLVSGPAIGGLIIAGHHKAALGALMIAGASDWLDGYVAKHYNIASTLGSYLDPLADKVLMGSVAAGLAWKGMLPVWLVSLVVARDVALIGAAALHRGRTLGWKWNSWSSYFQLGEGGAPKVRPLFISKANTVFQLALVGSALTHSAYGYPASMGVGALCYAVGTTTVLSWLGYLIVYLRDPAKLVYQDSVVKPTERTKG